MSHCRTCSCPGSVTTHPVHDASGIRLGTLLLTARGDGNYTGRLYRLPDGASGTVPLASMELLSAGLYDAQGTLIRELGPDEAL